MKKIIKISFIKFQNYIFILGLTNLELGFRFRVKGLSFKDVVLNFKNKK